MFRQCFMDEVRRTVETRLPEIQHIDIWNRNVEYADQEEPWAMPALFVEFGEIRWTPLKERTFRGMGSVIFHLVQPWDELQPSADVFFLAERLRCAITNMDDTSLFSIRTPEATLTNHDHAELIESIETFSVRFSFEIPEACNPYD